MTIRETMATLGYKSEEEQLDFLSKVVDKAFIVKYTRGKKHPESNACEALRSISQRGEMPKVLASVDVNDYGKVCRSVAEQLLKDETFDFVKLREQVCKCLKCMIDNVESCNEQMGL